MNFSCTVALLFTGNSLSNKPWSKGDNNALEYVFKRVKKDNANLSKNAEDYKHLRRAIGSKKTDEILEKAKAESKKKSRKVDYER